MRIVRVTVFASEEYRGESGYKQRRSLALEAEIESGDDGRDAMRGLQQHADYDLAAWTDRHKEQPAPLVHAVEPDPFPAPPEAWAVPVPAPVAQAVHVPRPAPGTEPDPFDDIQF